MFQRKMLRLALVPVLFASLCAGVQATQVDCDSVYCFTREEFPDAQALNGVCITGLPDSGTGTVMLGSRVVRPGDILTAEQLNQLTFHPLKTENDRSASLSYLPVFYDRVEKETTLTLSIRGKEDKAPVAEDADFETYKNLPLTGKLKITDPEGESLTYTVTGKPRRGEVTVGEDGTFTYTPKKNKVGTDSFTVTATDPAGHTSREAVITVHILKPVDNKQYGDTAQSTCRFTAEWMRSTGIFAGEQVGDSLCFNPEQTVSRGEFLAMLMRTLQLPTGGGSETVGFVDETPDWLKPYLSAALRYGLVAGYPGKDGPVFRPEQPITGAEAAVMVQNALKLPAMTAATQEEGVPVWAAGAMNAVQGGGISLTNSPTVTRETAANVMYDINLLCRQGLIMR